VRTAAWLDFSDLFAENGNRRREAIATYPYVDENGELLFEAVRFEPKDFQQRRPDGAGGWICNLKGTTRVLYRLPKVREAIAAGEPVFVVEGEKDVHALEHAGLVATCNPMGAGKWRPEHSEALRGPR
jgi:putative DNA primase/helicase